MQGHYADCAVHNEPAYPAGDCNCGGEITSRQKSLRPLQNPEIDSQDEVPESARPAR